MEGWAKGVADTVRKIKADEATLEAMQRFPGE